MSKWIISVAIGLVAALVVGILGINLVSPFVTTILGLNTTAWPAGLGAMVYVLNYVFVGGLAIVMVQMFLGKVMEQD